MCVYMCVSCVHACVPKLDKQEAIEKFVKDEQFVMHADCMNM